MNKTNATVIADEVYAKMRNDVNARNKAARAKKIKEIKESAEYKWMQKTVASLMKKYGMPDKWDSLNNRVEKYPHQLAEEEKNEFKLDFNEDDVYRFISIQIMDNPGLTAKGLISQGVDHFTKKIVKNID